MQIPSGDHRFVSETREDFGLRVGQTDDDLVHAPPGERRFVPETREDSGPQVGQPDDEIGQPDDEIGQPDDEKGRRNRDSKDKQSRNGY